MRYELVLQGNKTFLIEESDRQAILTAEKNQIKTIEIQGNRFDRSIIKGIFVHKEEVGDGGKQLNESDKVWYATCLGMSKRTVDHKTQVELNNRILPGLNLGKITLAEDLFASMKASIQRFFVDNALYPRCPMKIWWPFIADYVAPVTVIKNEDNEEVGRRRANPNMFMGKWWEYVSRNDEAIEEWVRYNK